MSRAASTKIKLPELMITYMYKIQIKFSFRHEVNHVHGFEETKGTQLFP